MIKDVDSHSVDGESIIGCDPDIQHLSFESFEIQRVCCRDNASDGINREPGRSDHLEFDHTARIWIGSSNRPNDRPGWQILRDFEGLIRGDHRRQFYIKHPRFNGIVQRIQVAAVGPCKMQLTGIIQHNAGQRLLMVPLHRNCEFAAESIAGRVEELGVDAAVVIRCSILSPVGPRNGHPSGIVQRDRRRYAVGSQE